MSVDQLGDLLLRWEELHAQDQTIAPEDLCRDCPELLPELQHHIQALKAMTRALNDRAQSTMACQGSAQPTSAARTGPSLAVPGYEIVGELGRGGMGVVYKARQTSLNRFVALKMILSGAHAGTQQRERFRREGEAAAHLKHPNIVQVYEVGEHERHPYCALEYVEGRPLNDVIREGVPPPAWSAAIIEELARAVDYAHRRGIVHRDLKPGNILLENVDSRQQTVDSSPTTTVLPTPNRANSTVYRLLSTVYFPKITDFGLAKRLDEKDSHTRTGDILGTPSYMAPEQAAGKSKEIGPPADIYALGAILYELLSGVPPFEGQSTWDIVTKVLNQDPMPPSRRNAQAPRDLETICLKCLHKEPAKRYETGLALAEDLHRYLNGEPIEARPVGQLERGVMWVRRRPGISVLLGTSAALLLALLIGGWVAALKQAHSNYALEQVNRANHQALVRLNITQGLHYVEDEDLIGSLVWFARALALERDDSRESTHRIRLASVLRQCPRLEQLWFHDASVTHISFSPDAHWVLTSSDDHTVRVWDALTGAPRFEPLRHDQAVLHAAFNRDGSRIVTGSADKTAAIWDALTGRRIVTLAGHEKPVRDAGFSPDGARVVTASADGTARLWDAASGAVIGTPLVHASPVVRASFHPDSARVLTCSEDGSARIWRIENGTANLERRIKHDGPVHDAIFSPDGSQVATCSEDGSARLWDTATGKPTAAPLRHHGSVLQVAFRPDGKRLATASADLTARVWDCKTGAALAPVLRHYSAVSSVAFSADGMRIVTGSDDNTCRLWDAENGRPITPPLLHNGEVGQVCFSPDGMRIATAAEDTTARIYELEPGETAIPTLQHAGPVLQASFDSTGARVLTASDDGIAHIWDAASGKRVAELRGHQGAVLDASFSSDGRHILTAGADMTARVWDAANFQMLRILSGHGGPVRTAAFSPDGSRILTTSDDGTARIWDRVSGNVLVDLGMGSNRERVVHAVFSPDGVRIATGSADGTVGIRDSVSGKQVGQCQQQLRQVLHLAFSPDRRQLAVACLDRTVRLLDTAAAGLPQTARLEHAGPVRDLDYRMDGKQLITCSDDNTARIWDAATGEQVLPPLRHFGSVTRACFSRDGTRLATASADNTGRVWDAATGEPLTPPLGHRRFGRITDVAFNPAGDRVVTASADGTAEIWPLQTTTCSAEDLEKFAQLLSGNHIGRDAGSLVPLDATSLRRLWEDVRTRHPELVGPKPQ